MYNVSVHRLTTKVVTETSLFESTMALPQPLEELSQQLARYEILCEDIMDKLREQPEDLQFHYNKLSNSSLCAKSGQQWLPDDVDGYILQLTSQCEATP